MTRRHTVEVAPDQDSSATSLLVRNEEITDSLSPSMQPSSPCEGDEMRVLTIHIEEEEEEEAGRSAAGVSVAELREVEETPLPLGKIVPIMLLTASESFNSSSIFSYVGYLVLDFDLTDDKKELGSVALWSLPWALVTRRGTHTRSAVHDDGTTGTMRERSPRASSWRSSSAGVCARA